MIYSQSSKKFPNKKTNNSSKTPENVIERIIRRTDEITEKELGLASEQIDNCKTSNSGGDRNSQLGSNTSWFN